MRNIRLGWPAVFFFSLIPILIWGSMQPLSTRFVNISVSMTSIGQLTALIGTVLLGITFFLSTRLKSVEDSFGGLDKVYKTHHILGTFSFLMLLFHPIFLAVKYAALSPNSAIAFLLPGSNFAVNFGIFALVSMILFLLFTFLISLKYDKWKLTHKFLGLSLLLATIHILFITSDISRNFALKIYLAAFITLGLLSFLYLTLIFGWLVKKYKYEIKKIRNLGNVIEITLEANRGVLHSPGQFVFVRFPSISKEFHPFSIASAPDEKGITIAVKSLGDYTSSIHKLKPGELAIVEGPYGRFGSNSKEQVWIAGGIGITPFLGMAKSLGDKKADIYYSVKNKDEAVFLDELENIAKKNKNLKVIPVFTSEQGFITAEIINTKTKNLLEKEILICGPPSMMQSLRKQLKEKGVKNNKIHNEEFQLL
jgi:predicted ferric reductase